ncbi:MAG: response regulator, partial [Candidatus Binatia bacterium]
FDLQNAVEEVVELMAPRAAEKNVELISFHAPDAPTRVIGDPGRIRQVLTNLVGNAIKFTPAGHVLVTVKCPERTEADALLRITVEDTGIGIAENQLERVFEKFTQADGSTTRQYGGTGLGLSICRQLVELMGGEISVSSRLGTGSAFSFTLRLAVEHETAVKPLPAADLESLRVLIVDDNRVNRRILEEQIASRGMKGRSVASAEEALRELHSARRDGEPYEIAIVDYQMPGMDGERLGREIKASPSLRDTMLVMLTSVGQQGDGKRMTEAGFSGYLVKPVRQSQLFGALSTAWALYRQGAAPQLVTRHTLSEARRREVARTGRSQGGLAARILLAEDNALNQKVALRMLEQLGCRADLAANGKEAVQMLEAFAYDLVLMDCEMPKMDGFEASAEIRRRETGSGRRVPIVAMTAHALAGARERCLSAGMDDHLPKPVKLDELRGLLG